MGITSALCQFLGNVPQIIVTYQSKELGSFSLATLFMQTPGSVLLAFFQFIQASDKIGIWLPYLVGAVLQIILLIECIFFVLQKRIRDKKMGKSELEIDVENTLKQNIDNKTY